MNQFETNFSARRFWSSRIHSTWKESYTILLLVISAVASRSGIWTGREKQRNERWVEDWLHQPPRLWSVVRYYFLNSSSSPYQPSCTSTLLLFHIMYTIQANIYVLEVELHNNSHAPLSLSLVKMRREKKYCIVFGNLSGISSKSIVRSGENGKKTNASMIRWCFSTAIKVYSARFNSMGGRKKWKEMFNDHSPLSSIASSWTFRFRDFSPWLGSLDEFWIFKEVGALLNDVKWLVDVCWFIAGREDSRK